ncbi:sugar-binding domain-containing protein [Schlesneria sp. DSM 10557]|uniref:glycoside hydrolase family 2 protein n=1 Tax=Schlesneria sp. DSM 10557 TaxID=3044399 RepID=UPI0035A074E6
MKHLFLLVIGLWSLPCLAGEWKAKSAPLMTKWAAEVSPANAHPEYPRPQLVRKDWLNLNGLWDYSIEPKEAARPGRWQTEAILVPFPVESALSGVMELVGPEQKLWYRRTFQIPRKDDAVDPAWVNQRVLLHFGAVDWETTVFVNGHEVGSHRGGYDPFSFDITSVLKPDAENELIVAVWDPSDAGYQGRGKQVQKPGGIFYTPTTGIWQTVWLEPVPQTYIRDVTIAPDLDQRQLTIQTDVVNPQPGWKLGIVVRSQTATGGITHRRWQTDLKAPARITLSDQDPNFASYIWSPSNPHLIDVHVALVEDASADLLGFGQEWLPKDPGVIEAVDPVPLADLVSSYTALRKISVGKDAHGITRILLNDKPLFQVGPLDQGFWPDGLYTAPTDEAMKFDIDQTRAYGFNLIRKHVKVEPATWYHHCDKTGMLVWQDMPSGDRSAQWDPFGKFDNQELTRSAESAADYRREWKSIIDSRRAFPCIVMWVPFNEGWGQSETVAITKWTKEYDPSRLVNCASGGNDFPVGDVIDVHRYPGPVAPVPTTERASVLGEFGGLGLPLEGHTWQGKENWGYRNFEDQASLTAAYLDLFDQLHPLIEKPGLSAAIYTQTTDVETEVNGLMTYDRKVLKIPVEAAAKAHAALFQPARQLNTVVPTSRDEAVTWQYTLEKPSDGWEKPAFDATAWKSAPGGFGEKSTPSSVVRTEWKSNDIWLRRTFDLKTDPKGEIRLIMHHDEDAEVYLNGELLKKVSGYSTDYRQFRLSPQAQKALTRGTNTLAVHCKQTGGGQYIDVGLVELAE